jgi:hypothetical protein
LNGEKGNILSGYGARGHHAKSAQLHHAFNNFHYHPSSAIKIFTSERGEHQARPRRLGPAARRKKALSAGLEKISKPNQESRFTRPSLARHLSYMPSPSL